MHETGSGLKGRPFRAGPDTAAYYPSTTHERALEKLVQAIKDDEGLCLLTGLAGMGKSLVCLCLVDRLGSDVNCALITNSHLPDRVSLFQAILYDFSVPYQGAREQELRLTLTDHLLSQYGKGRRTLLVVDEAQHLSSDLLEEIRLLGNLEGARGKALQVVLAGQAEILETLQRPELRILSQRLAVRIRLEPLDLHEAGDFLVHQVRVAGRKPEELFSDEALEVIARSTGGVPRLLNQAAHRSLLLSQQLGVSTVDVEVALEAVAMLGLDDQPLPQNQTPFPSLVAPDEAEDDPFLRPAVSTTLMKQAGPSDLNDSDRRPA
jgi:type II secretory pathway predicted ATPase ExeA